jgi:hypothetical protein
LKYEHDIHEALDTILGLKFHDYYVVVIEECFGNANREFVKWLKDEKGKERTEDEIPFQMDPAIRKKLDERLRTGHAIIRIDIDINRMFHNEDDETTYSISGHAIKSNISGFSEMQKNCSPNCYLHDEIESDETMDILLDSKFARGIRCDALNTEVIVEAVIIWLQ